MASQTAAAADAIAAALNAAPGGTFAMPFEAVRVYLPGFDLEELETLRVTVVPAAFEPSHLSRSHVQKELTVDVGVHARLPQGTEPYAPAANAVIDAHVGLLEQIAAFFKPGQYGGATFVRCSADSIADPEQLRMNNVFFAFARVTLKTF